MHRFAGPIKANDAIYKIQTVRPWDLGTQGVVVAIHSFLHSDASVQEAQRNQRSFISMQKKYFFLSADLFERFIIKIVMRVCGRRGEANAHTRTISISVQRYVERKNQQHRASEMLQRMRLEKYLFSRRVRRYADQEDNYHLRRFLFARTCIPIALFRVSLLRNKRIACGKSLCRGHADY